MYQGVKISHQNGKKDSFINTLLCNFNSIREFWSKCDHKSDCKNWVYAVLCLAYKSGVYKQFQSQIGAGLNLAALCTDHPPPPQMISLYTCRSKMIK